VLVARVRNQRRVTRAAEQRRQVKAVDGVEKEQGPHPFVEVGAFAAKRLERLTFGEQLGQRRSAADRLDGTVSRRRRRRRDDLHEPGWCRHHRHHIKADACHATPPLFVSR
jgi:hypothetical protein